MRFAILSLIAVSAFSCASTYKEKFYISAIDSNEKELTCAVLLENEPALNEKNETVCTPAWVEIPFVERVDGRGYEGVKLCVRFVELDAEGKIVRGAKEGEQANYFEDSRVLYPKDAKRQLFVLRRNKSVGQ